MLKQSSLLPFCAPVKPLPQATHLPVRQNNCQNFLPYMPRHTNKSPNVFPFLDSGRKFKNNLIIKAFLRATVESLFLSAQKKKKKKKKIKKRSQILLEISNRLSLNNSRFLILHRLFKCLVFVVWRFYLVQTFSSVVFLTNFHWR